MTESRKSRSPSGRLAIVPLLLACFANALMPGCGSSGSGSSIPNIVSSAAPLSEDGRSYTGPQLEIPRYGHTTTSLLDGRAVVIGGSDERFLTSIVLVEVFDQGLIAQPRPESESGAFFSTDVNGDPIHLRYGGRVFHTATRLPDGNVLVAGGTADILTAEATAEGEIFETTTRLFAPDNLAIQNNMIQPRFRHTATLLPNGKVLLVGGQTAVATTVIDDNFPPGHPLFSVQVETFPSTETIEIFDPTARQFQLAQNLSGGAAELVTPRGRSDLASVAIAGPDLRLGTADDVILNAGGYQTLSLNNAPQTKFPQQFGLSLLTGVEYYDPATGINASAPNVGTAPRANGVQLVNLGQFRDTTIDGVEGVSNLALLTHGDNNDLCRTSVAQSEIIAVTFTGFGPSNGITFTTVVDPGQQMNYEGFTFDPDNCVPIGRSEAPTIVMPIQRVYDGEKQFSNWVFTAGGEHLYCAPGQNRGLTGICSNEIQGFMAFDPFYTPFVDPPWDQSQTRGLLTGLGGADLNPTGIVGSWLNHDRYIPDDSSVGYAGPTPGDVNPLVAMVSRRSFHTMTAVPGVDGIPNTFDDRILIVGGGLNVPNNGDEPVSISCEIYLPPGANDAN